jgi:chemotaxis protein methyltransferase CheR
VTNDQDLLTEDVFNNLRRFFFMKTGNSLSEKKRYLVLYRLAHLVGPDKEYKTYRDLCQRVHSDPDGPEAERLITLLTTHFSYFFREPDHFDFFREVLSRYGSRFHELRVWSAACSTGEEPYSLAITALDCLGAEAIRIKILGTDVSSEAIDKARKGIYNESAIEGKMETGRIHRWFDRDQAGKYRVKPEVRALVRLKEFNLLEPFPFNKRFHVIFLRNVLYYLGQDARADLMKKLTASLVDGGYLVLGHMDTVPVGVPGMSNRGGNIFKKL